MVRRNRAGQCAIHLWLGAVQQYIGGIAIELAEARAELVLKGRARFKAADASSAASTGSITWPERDAIDAMTQFMSEQAAMNRLTLRTYSVSHIEPSIQARGHVVVEVAASGSYADLKNWQGGSLARFQSLAVRSLRLLSPSGGGSGSGGIEAPLVWVLHVRD